MTGLKPGDCFAEILFDIFSPYPGKNFRLKSLADYF